MASVLQCRGIFDREVGRAAETGTHAVRAGGTGQDDEQVGAHALDRLLDARLHALAGARTIGLDRAARRVELLTAAGVEARTASIAETAAAIPTGVDIVVDATGVPAVVPQAITLLKPVPLSDAEQPDTRYLVQGSYAGDIAFPYPEAFRRQVTVLAPKAHQPRDRFAIMELSRQGRLCGRDLVSAVRTPDQAEQTYRELLDPQTSLLTAAFEWKKS